MLKFASKLNYFLFLALIAAAPCCIKPALAEQQDLEVAASPKKPWQGFETSSNEQTSLGRKVLLWLPNRFLDFVDLLRLDIGAGPAAGAVARVSSHGQAGYRVVRPFSFRVGVFGRKAPVLFEESDESGFGPGFKGSVQRYVCPGEVGLGADLGIGVYGGICLEEAVDFLAGLVFIDLMKDDVP